MSHLTSRKIAGEIDELLNTWNLIPEKGRIADQKLPQSLIFDFNSTINSGRI